MISLGESYSGRQEECHSRVRDPLQQKPGAGIKKKAIQQQEDQNKCVFLNVCLRHYPELAKEYKIQALHSVKYSEAIKCSNRDPSSTIYIVKQFSVQTETLHLHMPLQHTAINVFLPFYKWYATSEKQLYECLLVCLVPTWETLVDDLAGVGPDGRVNFVGCFKAGF